MLLNVIIDHVRKVLSHNSHSAEFALIWASMRWRWLIRALPDAIRWHSSLDSWLKRWGHLWALTFTNERWMDRFWSLFYIWWQLQRSFLCYRWWHATRAACKKLIPHRVAFLAPFPLVFKIFNVLNDGVKYLIKCLASSPFFLLHIEFHGILAFACLWVHQTDAVAFLLIHI